MIGNPKKPRDNSTDKDLNQVDQFHFFKISYTCLLYTSDAADERSSVDLGGRRIIKKKKNREHVGRLCL